MTQNNQQQVLMDRYRSLSDFEQHVLQLCSVIYTDVTRTNILRLFHKTGLPFPEGRFAKVQQLSPYVNRLQELGFLDAKLRCHSEIIEFLSRQAHFEGHYLLMAKVVLEAFPSPKIYRGYRGIDSRQCPYVMRDFRIGIYTCDVDTVLKNGDLIMSPRCCETLVPKDPFLMVTNNPFNAEWFRGLPQKIQLAALTAILNDVFEGMKPDREPLACALNKDFLKALSRDEKERFCALLATRLLLGGRINEVKPIIRMLVRSEYTAGFNGWTLFLEGKNDEALQSYDEDLKVFRKMVGGRNEYFRGMAGIFYVLAQLKNQNDALLPKMKRILKKAMSYSYRLPFMPTVYAALDRVCDIQMGNVDRKALRTYMLHAGDGGLGDYFEVFSSYWLNNRLSAAEVECLETVCSRAGRADWKWLVMECALLLSRAPKRNVAKFKTLAGKIQKETGMVSILDMVPREELWQKSLRALMTNAPSGKRSAGAPGNARLIWLFSFSGGDIWLQPIEQKLGKKGTWSKGRNVALKRLMQGTHLNYITDQDRRISQTIYMDNSYYSGATYYFDTEKAILELIDHPLVFKRSSPSTPVSIVKGEPVVSVKESGSRFKIQFSPNVADRSVVMLERSANRIEVIQVSDEHRRIAGILGKDGLSVPLEGKAEILAAIGAISGAVAVHSSIGGAAEKVTETKADSVPRMRIWPSGEGFRLEMLAKPFGDGGPYVKPGTGNETLIAGVNGKRMQTRRNLKREAKMAAEVEAGCPGLIAGRETDFEWRLSEPEDCLQVLTELRPLQDENRVVMEWPEGETLRVTRNISFDRLKMGITSGTDWFEVKGELKLDENLVLDMTKLLNLIKESENRFIPLGDGQFAALTAEFRKRLLDLDAVSYQKGKAVRFHPFSALFLAEFAENMTQVKSDRKWRAMLKRLKDVRDSVPAVPSTLKAELRDYQETGYRWMTRLSHWGVGACLADDMGLGKTVQVLGVLLNRAANGPALVIAPTSVCTNWILEARRFAPTLNPVMLDGKDREGIVSGLKDFDVLVTSYGLLVQESDLLTSVSWHTIVLDEAQAVKNVAAKRSRAANRLKGDFRVITTGTPIENYLGEFWSLFNFINPGLLGSLKRFNERFVLPIEKARDQTVHKRLKKMIQPFVLRRIKSDVLDELPPRTEVTLHVEMDKKEAAFYEALRQNALQKLDMETGPAPRKHFKILAEITRLRRACCQPRLILPESPLSGAKLTLFKEVVAELLENRHKALVFSQFVGHLNILREYLDRKKIDYRYLDGSTPAKARRKQVARFQKGEGDLFLISLKAGGLGLNLTAASYVIHMDPWWNPAVEDQASDRVHRIGQQHPVTVYRLVTRGTIEEKIISLHQKKRELADSLLSGSDMAGRVSAEELLRLIREG